MGISLSGSLATKNIGHPVVSWDVPEEWSLEDAATVPIIYSSVVYGLTMVNNFTFI